MRVVGYISFASALLLAVGCGSGEREYRVYQEMTVSSGPRIQATPAPPPETPQAAADPGAAEGPSAAASRGGMGALPVGMNTPSASLSWTAPEGWEELPGDGLRLVTFRIANAECAITTFPGDVGGTEANLRRWWGQVTTAPFTSDRLARVMAEAVAVTTAGGLSGQVYDFGPVLPAEANQSTIAGILDLGGDTAFVKLTGDRTSVSGSRDGLIALVRSIGAGP